MNKRRIIVKLAITLVAVILVVATKQLIKLYGFNMSRYIALDKTDYEMVEKLLKNS